MFVLNTYVYVSRQTKESTRDSNLKAIKQANIGDIEMHLEFARSSNMSRIIAAAITQRCFHGNSSEGTR